MLVHLPKNGNAGWELGLGEAVKGLLPSTYDLDYEYIAKERGDA